MLRGEIKPGDALEQVALAQVCLKQKQRPAAATRFYAGGFKANGFLKLPTTQHHYTAGCAALLATDGPGIDAALTSADERSAFRKQATIGSPQSWPPGNGWSKLAHQRRSDLINR